jgi:hypothetical protein
MKHFKEEDFFGYRYNSSDFFSFIGATLGVLGDIYTFNFDRIRKSSSRIDKKNRRIRSKNVENNIKSSA